MRKLCSFVDAGKVSFELPTIRPRSATWMAMVISNSVSLESGALSKASARIEKARSRDIKPN